MRQSAIAVVSAVSLLLLSACGSPLEQITCGDGTHLDGTTCLPDASDAGQVQTQPTKAFVSSLTTSHRSGDAVFTNHPLRLTMGVTSTGEPKDVLVTLGLMEKPAATASDEDLQNLKSCVLQGSQIHLSGDGKEHFTTFDALIPPECLDGGPERTFNFQLIVDLVEDTLGQDPREKILVFNEREKDNPINAQCKLLDSVADANIPGCALDLLVKPSPGLNIAIEKAVPSSSVVVVYPAIQHPDTPAGEPEGPRGALSIQADVRAYGRDAQDANAGTLPQPVTVTYDVLAQPDNSNVGWKPLTTNADSELHPFPTIRPGQAISTNVALAMPAETRALLAPAGAWYGIDSFLVRVCVNVPFEERGDPVVSGSDGRGDNCRWFPIRLVFASSPPSQANSFSAGKVYEVGWGSKKAVGVFLKVDSENNVDLSGAHTEQSASFTVDSIFGSMTPFEGKATADALLTESSGAFDSSLRMFDNTVFTYNRKSPSFTYAKEISYSKQLCQRYVFAALIVPVNVKFCVGGESGLSLSANLSGNSITPRVRPYASMDASAGASVGEAGFRISVELDATILSLNGGSGDGGSATISLTPSASALDIAVNTKFLVSVATLDIDFRLVLEAEAPDICKKKIAGIKIKYPCFHWKDIDSFEIAHFGGYKYNYTVLNRTYSATLQ